MKPLFYMLAKHGPWDHHVEIFSMPKIIEAFDMLDAAGYKENVDFEALEDRAIATKKNMDSKKLRVIFLLRDRNMALRLKLALG